MTHEHFIELLFTYHCLFKSKESCFHIIKDSRINLETLKFKWQLSEVFLKLPSELIYYKIL
jgi:hypothetical protein